MRHATPCPTVFSAPDQRLNTTPTLPGWMIVNDPQTAASTKTMSPRATPLASICGALPRKSSAIGILPFEAAVPPALEHDDPTAAAPRPASQRPGEARLQAPTEGTQRYIERQHEDRQEDDLASADHCATYSLRRGAPRTSKFPGARPVLGAPRLRPSDAPR